MAKNGSFTANTTLNEIKVGDQIAVSKNYDDFQVGVVVATGEGYLITDDFTVDANDITNGTIILKHNEAKQ